MQKLTKVLITLSESEQDLFDVYNGPDGLPVFDWGPHRCIDFDLAGTFQVGICTSIEQVLNVLNQFDSTFGTAYVLGDIISSKVTLV